MAREHVTMAAADWTIFDTRQALAEALADKVADVLSQAIASRGQATLAVSGGTTPGRFFDALSTRAIAWDKVSVTLVDERFVPETSERSNAALVKSRLLTNEAGAARFVALFRDAANADAAATLASEAIVSLPLPLDAVVLGMGTDGHTASFFPDATTLDTLLNPGNTDIVLAVDAETAGEPRLTLTLARLLEAGFLCLHIEGEEKRAVLETALKPSASKPISAVFNHANAPVPVYWAG